MIKVAPYLHVGSDEDYATAHDQGWYVVSAAKEPHHRHLLGYTGHGVEPAHREYYAALRDRHLVLNWVDVADPKFFRREELLLATGFIMTAMENPNIGRSEAILIHCNQGQSRSAALALYWLRLTDQAYRCTFEEAEALFRQEYPPYNPAAGIREFIRGQW